MNRLKIQRFAYKMQYTHSVEEEMNFLKSLPSPNDDIDRSYLQYLCQFFITGKGRMVLCNLIAFAALPAVFLKLCFTRKKLLICVLN